MMTDLGLSEAELTSRGIFMVHPSFRIVALATPPTKSAPWLTNEMLNLFHFFSLEMDVKSDVGREHAALLVESVVSNLPVGMAPKLATLAAKLAMAQDDDDRM